MTKIFVAGAYNGSNIIECLDNIKRGLRISAYLLNKGYVVFSPWTDFLFHLVADTKWTSSLETYRKYCLSLIEISDLVFVISGDVTHEGVMLEINHARKNSIPTIINRSSTDLLSSLHQISLIPLSEKIYQDLCDSIEYSK